MFIIYIPDLPGGRGKRGVAMGGTEILLTTAAAARRFKLWEVLLLLLLILIILAPSNTIEVQ